MTTNYISIRSVMYDLYLTLNDRLTNENQMLEWAYKALRLIRSDAMLESKLAVLDLVDHKVTLPSDLKYLTQIMYKFTNSTTEDLIIDNMIFPEGSTLPDQLNVATGSMLTWRPMRLTSNPYHASICLDESITQCPDCAHSFSVGADLILTSTLQAATIMVAYLGYPTDTNGDALIPDNEELKEAILYYLLYRYWMAKYNMMEEGAESRMKNYLAMWNTLSKKAAGNMNLPDVNEMENLKNIFNRLVPRETQFSKGFLTLTNSELRDF